MIELGLCTHRRSHVILLQDVGIPHRGAVGNSSIVTNNLTYSRLVFLKDPHTICSRGMGAHFQYPSVVCFVDLGRNSKRKKRANNLLVGQIGATMLDLDVHVCLWVANKKSIYIFICIYMYFIHWVPFFC